MINITNQHEEQKRTIREIFDYDNTCLLEDGRLAICAWMKSDVYNKVCKDGYIFCFTISNEGENSIEYIKTNTPAIPCDVEITIR